jgi:hypothetical protein
MKKGVLLIVLLLSFLASTAQVDTTAALYKTIKTNDSLLFTIGFNTCDITQFEKLVSDTFEFYHDKSGLTNSKDAFIASIKTGLCKSDYKASRELVAGSMQVFPLENNDVLYGAVQTGKHRFYEVGPDNVKKQTSTAHFTHIWLLENGVWKLSRVISYNHIATEKK